MPEPSWGSQGATPSAAGPFWVRWSLLARPERYRDSSTLDLALVGEQDDGAVVGPASATLAGHCCLPDRARAVLGRFSGRRWSHAGRARGCRRRLPNRLRMRATCVEFGRAGRFSGHGSVGVAIRPPARGGTRAVDLHGRRQRRPLIPEMVIQAAMAWSGCDARRMPEPGTVRRRTR